MPRDGVMRDDCCSCWPIL